jgi:hypothetical protein
MASSVLNALPHDSPMLMGVCVLTALRVHFPQRMARLRVMLVLPALSLFKRQVFVRIAVLAIMFQQPAQHSAGF